MYDYGMEFVDCILEEAAWEVAGGVVLLGIRGVAKSVQLSSRLAKGYRNYKGAKKAAKFGDASYGLKSLDAGDSVFRASSSSSSTAKGASRISLARLEDIVDTSGLAKCVKTHKITATQSFDKKLLTRLDAAGKEEKAILQKIEAASWTPAQKAEAMKRLQIRSNLDRN